MTPRILLLVVLMASAVFAQNATDQDQSAAVQGIADGIMSPFFGSAFPSFPSSFGSNNNRGRQLAFMPQVQGPMNPALTFRQNVQQVPASNAAPQSQSARQPNNQGGGGGPANFNMPLMQDLGSFLGSFGGPILGLGQQQGDQQGSPMTTQQPDQGSFFNNPVPINVPNFGFGGNPLPMRCYMSNQVSQINANGNGPCNLPQEPRYYFDMLKNQCVGQLICPKYTANGWSTQQDSPQNGFASAQECVNTCIPTTTTAAPTAPPTTQPITLPPAPAPAPLPPKPVVPYNPSFLDGVTLPSTVGPTQLPFRLP